MRVEAASVNSGREGSRSAGEGRMKVETAAVDPKLPFTVLAAGSWHAPNRTRVAGQKAQECGVAKPSRGQMTNADGSAVVAENPEGTGPFVIVCDHASNRIPEEWQSFGFAGDALATHIAWDPGALAVARRLSARLDAPLFWPDVSRLVIDCNRAPDVSSLIVTESEGRKVEANRAVSAAERSRRLDRIHTPYHEAIDSCLTRRLAARLATVLIAVHSFTPACLGKARPWQVGIVFDDDRRMADLLVRGLKADPALTVGINQPYAPADHVYYTVARHAGPRGLPAAMVEIRNDEIGDEIGQRSWADRLADILLTVTPGLRAGRHAMA
jgi:predicted N-formylglutamate amidohydrolase